jgi:hypothetical protein
LLDIVSRKKSSHLVLFLKKTSVHLMMTVLILSLDFYTGKRTGGIRRITSEWKTMGAAAIHQLSNRSEQNFLK